MSRVPQARAIKRLAGEHWAQFLGICLLLTVAYYLSLAAPLLRATWYTLIGALSILAIAYGILKRIAEPWAWIWIGIGLLLYFTGDVIFNYYRFALHVARPFPSIADAFFLLARFPLIIGLIQITRRAGGRASAFSLLDTLIVASGLGLLWWAFFMAPQAYNPHFSPLERFIAVAYPATDFLLLATGIRLAFTSAKRTPPSFMLGAALAGLLGADVIYSILQLNHIYQVGTWIDLGWIGFYVFLGAVALYPAPDIKPVPANLTERHLALRLGLLTLAALLLPVTIAVSRFIPSTLDWVTVALGTALVILVMLRMQRLMQQNLALQKEVALWKSDLLFRSIISRAYSGVSVLRSDLTISFSNPRMHQLADLDTEQTDFRELLHPDDLLAFEKFWSDTLSPERSIPSLEFRIRDASGQWRDVESTSNNLLDDEWIHGVVLITQDISARKRYERELKRMAYTDLLTGLPNRAALSQRLEEAVAMAAGENKLAAAAFIDLDNFKEINDSLGHAIGDRTLIELSKRLAGKKGDGTFVARFGGDEFVLVAEHLRHKADAQLFFSERLARVFDRPLYIEPYEVHLSTCVGIAFSHHGQVSGPELIDNASVALHHAKANGQGVTRVFSDDLLALSKRRRDLSLALRDILAGHDNGSRLQLKLQPIAALNTKELVGAEIVAYLQHDQFGNIGQNELASLAYETDLLAELESRTLARACKLLKAWSPSLKQSPFRLHVNVSAASYRAPHYDQVVLETLAAFGVPPRRLTLQVIESNLLSATAAAMASLGPLIDKGVWVAINDFGQADVLSQFQHLPHTSVKIDRSITLAASQKSTAVLLSGIASIAHKLGRKVIADGIDTSSQAERMLKLGCDYGQGDYFGSPMPEDELAKRLTTQLQA